MYYQNIVKNSLKAILVCLSLMMYGCGKSEQTVLPESDSIRSTEQGPVIGASGQYGGHQWLGMPYAQPPVEDRRWRAPSPPESRKDTFTATKHASPCPQLATRLGGVRKVKEGTPVGSEDCLYLDVYAPEFSSDQVPDGKDQLPVMLWIHGGGNVVGHSGLYDASRLASEENVIVVAVQYRLGALGWFRHPALRKANLNSVEQSGNYALLDLIHSLKWVRKNIDSFGGDPENITIFGESAGGRNVYNLMLSPLAEGLFDRAIVQSGVLSTMNPKHAEQYKTRGGHHSSSREVLVRLLQADDRATSRTQARSKLESMSTEETADYLRNQSPTAIMNTLKSSELGIPLDPPRVFADGTVLPEEEPLEVFRDSDQYHDVPVITGTNHDETKIFLFEDDRWKSRILWLIPQLYEPDLYQLIAEYSSKQWKAHAVDQPATVLSQSQDDVYAYRFDWDESPTMLGTDLSKILGASHGFEIPFVFGNFNFGGEMAEYLFTDENQTGRIELSKRIRTYWTEFARTGNPNPNGETKVHTWYPWSNGPDAMKYMIMDTSNDGGFRMGSKTYDPQNLRDQVKHDPRISSRRNQCVTLRTMAMYVGHFSKADYKQVDACEDYEWAGYPWR